MPRNRVRRVISTALAVVTSVLAACSTDQALGLRVGVAKENLTATAKLLDARRLSAYARQSQGCVFDLQDASSGPPRRMSLPSSMLPFTLPIAKPFRVSERTRAVAKHVSVRINLETGETLVIRCISSRAASDGKLPAISRKQLTSQPWLRTLAWLRRAPRAQDGTRTASAEADFLRYVMTGRSRGAGLPRVASLTNSGLKVVSAKGSNVIFCNTYVYSSVIVGYDTDTGMWIDEDENGNCSYVDYYDGLDQAFDPLSDAMDQMAAWNDPPISAVPDYLADDDALNMDHPFDCDGKPCPTGQALLYNQQIQEMAKKLLAMSNASPDNLEFGVFVFCNGDGTLRFSSIYAGEIKIGGLPVNEQSRRWRTRLRVASDPFTHTPLPSQISSLPQAMICNGQYPTARTS